jgi:hypothetical protein
MADLARSVDFAAPGHALGRQAYRDRAPTSARPGVSIRLKGCPDDSCRRRLRTVVGRCCKVSPVVASASVAHVDMAEVTRLEPAVIDLLNETYAKLTAAGWLFRITPPADTAARLTFLSAATDGRLRWA